MNKNILQTTEKYKIDNIYCVDCYAAIKNIPDKSIDLIYTDIPYDIDKNGGGGALANINVIIM